MKGNVFLPVSFSHMILMPEGHRERTRERLRNDNTGREQSKQDMGGG
jgi:hypothetical protein